MRRRRLLSIVVMGLLMVFWISPVMSADFPTKPITYLVPWGAGGSDARARVLAKETSQYLGQPVMVENKPGGGGTLGPATMAGTAKPDGYTIAELSVPVYRYPHMFKVTYDPLKDFTFIIHLTGYTFGVVVKADSPFKTFNDFVAYAKANPGKATYATTGTASMAYGAMEMLARKNGGIKWTNVPASGGDSELVSNVLGGHIMVGVTTSKWAPLVKSGDFRLLATFSEERIKNFPDAPTVKELGYNIVVQSPYGLGGPKGMDPKVVKALHDAFKKGLESPAYQKMLAEENMPTIYKNSEDYAKFAKEIWAEEKEVVEMLGLKPKEK
jgi:tripartite-type tricarboxylate transporter receptor subunit TctC